MNPKNTTPTYTHTHWTKPYDIYVKARSWERARALARTSEHIILIVETHIWCGNFSHTPTQTNIHTSFIPTDDNRKKEKKTNQEARWEKLIKLKERWINSSNWWTMNVRLDDDDQQKDLARKRYTHTHTPDDNHIKMYTTIHHLCSRSANTNSLCMRLCYYN